MKGSGSGLFVMHGFGTLRGLQSGMKIHQISGQRKKRYTAPSSSTISRVIRVSILSNIASNLISSSLYFLLKLRFLTP